MSDQVHERQTKRDVEDVPLLLGGLLAALLFLLSTLMGF